MFRCRVEPFFFKKEYCIVKGFFLEPSLKGSWRFNRVLLGTYLKGRLVVSQVMYYTRCIYTMRSTV